MKYIKKGKLYIEVSKLEKTTKRPETKKSKEKKTDKPIKQKNLKRP